MRITPRRLGQRLQKSRRPPRDFRFCELRAMKRERHTRRTDRNRETGARKMPGAACRFSTVGPRQDYRFRQIAATMAKNAFKLRELHRSWLERAAYSAFGQFRSRLRGASALGPVFYGNRTKYYDQNRP